jgi:hypothetical protein
MRTGARLPASAAAEAGKKRRAEAPGSAAVAEAEAAAPAALTRPPRRLLPAARPAGRPRATCSSAPAELPGRRRPLRQPALFPSRGHRAAAASSATSAGRDPGSGGPGGGSGGGGRRAEEEAGGRAAGSEGGAEEESLVAGRPARWGRGAQWRAPAGRARGGQQIDGAGEVAAATAGATHPASSCRGPGSKAAWLRD